MTDHTDTTPRFTLPELHAHRAQWFDQATALRAAVQAAAKRRGLVGFRLDGWDFDTYVTESDTMEIGATCITFSERDYEGDRAALDLPFAIADGSISIEEWVTVAFAAAQERIDRERENARHRQALVDQRERAEYERLRAKYGQEG